MRPPAGIPAGSPHFPEYSRGASCPGGGTCVTVNIITGIVSIVVGGFYLVSALLLPNMTMGDRLGPKLFPLIIAVLAIIAGIALILGDALKKGEKSAKADFGFKTHKDIWFKILAITVAGIVYGLILDSVGFLLSTALFMFFMTMMTNKKKIGQNVIVALSFSIAAYLIFAVALKLSLPRGFIETALPF